MAVEVGAGMRYLSRATPFAIAINLAIGLLRLIEPENRYLSAAFDAAKEAWAWTGVFPIRIWGGIMLLCAVALYVVRNRDMQLRVVAFLCSGVWILWGSLQAISAYDSGHGNVCQTEHIVNGCHLPVGYSGAVFYWFAAAIHLLLVFRTAPLDRRQRARRKVDRWQDQPRGGQVMSMTAQQPRTQRHRPQAPPA